MKPVNVIWRSFHKPDAIERGYWDQGLLEDTFAKGDFVHHTAITDMLVGQGAVYVINGRMHTEDTAKINEEINLLSWVLFIITGDEEAVFPWREIKHPIMRVWVQLPRMNEHNDTSFKLPNGYRPETRKLLKQIGQQERNIDIFFAGQVNHPRREQCVEALESLNRDVYSIVLTKTDGFGKEVLPYPEYMADMAATKIVLCPSGIESPDNFRLYEALEAGCVPVVDAFSTRHQAPGFWQYLFGGQPPFPIVDYWDKLPELVPTLLKEYPANADRIFAWWQQYKRALFYNLTDTIKELSK